MANPTATLVPLNRPSTAAALQAQLQASERQIDAGLVAAGELIGKTIRAAGEAAIHRTAIQRMLLRLHSAQGHALKAQWDLQLFHQQCREQLRKLDTEELGWGDTGSPNMDPAEFAAAQAEALG